MDLRKWVCGICMLYLILGTWKGYVALFDKKMEEPRQIYPYLAASLPEADQTALENGIVIRSEKRLQEILEDYLS